MVCSGRLGDPVHGMRGLVYGAREKWYANVNPRARKIVLSLIYREVACLGV